MADFFHPGVVGLLFAQGHSAPLGLFRHAKKQIQSQGVVLVPQVDLRSRLLGKPGGLVGGSPVIHANNEATVVLPIRGLGQGIGNKWWNWNDRAIVSP